jgi:hypothetical protein
MGCGGRFGNQLFAYAFAKSYARQHGLELRVPSDWIGRYIFEIPEKWSDGIVYRHSQLDSIPNGEAEIDLYGYYQYQSAINYSLADIKEWFVFQPKWKELFNRYRETCKDIVVCHLRGGDYLNLPEHFCYVQPISYWNTLTNLNLRERTVQWVSEYNPTREYDVPDSIGFLPDFMILMATNMLLRSNSTFGWWAATLRAAMFPEIPQNVYSPVVKGKFGPNICDFVAGNHPQMASRDTPTLSDLYVR